MPPSFEPIYEALKARLVACGALVTVDRKFRSWSTVSPSEMPAVFITQKGEFASRVRGQPARWTLIVELVLYVAAGEGDGPPSTLINEVLAEIRAILEVNPATGVPDGFEGMVAHAWIKGQVEIFEGTLGQQSAAIIPVELLTV